MTTKDPHILRATRTAIASLKPVIAQNGGGRYAFFKADLHPDSPFETLSAKWKGIGAAINDTFFANFDFKKAQPPDTSPVFVPDHLKRHIGKENDAKRLRAYATKKRVDVATAGRTFGIQLACAIEHSINSALKSTHARGAHTVVVSAIADATREPPKVASTAGAGAGAGPKRHRFMAKSTYAQDEAHAVIKQLTRRGITPVAAELPLRSAETGLATAIDILGFNTETGDMYVIEVKRGFKGNTFHASSGNMTTPPDRPTCPVVHHKNSSFHRAHIQALVACHWIITEAAVAPTAVRGLVVRVSDGIVLLSETPTWMLEHRAEIMETFNHSVRSHLCIANTRIKTATKTKRPRHTKK